MSATGNVDFVVVGGGIVGLSCAAALAPHGSIRLFRSDLPGEASPASAGMLAPSLERLHPASRSVGIAARDLYPALVERLQERTGIRVPLSRAGIVELDPPRDAGEKIPATAISLSPAELIELEPKLSAVEGAVLHPGDGWVDNVRLLEALSSFLATCPELEVIADSVVEISAREVAVHTASGRSESAGAIVLAPGAWCAGIRGLPRQIPVRPARGQILALKAPGFTRAIAAADGYLVPRNGELLVGSTMEWVGFDPSTTAEALAHLRSVAARISPALGSAPESRSWAGLRPATPDLLPIIGRDPEHSALVYACGHSRNGVLLAPLTGECVSALVRGAEPPVDLRQFSIERFELLPEPANLRRAF